MLLSRNRLKIIIITCCILISGLLPALRVFSLDYPHFSINIIGCDSCHFVYGSQPSLMPPWTEHIPQDIDDTQYNTLCWSCHNDIDAPHVKTHSSIQTDSGYSNWTVECRVCHAPHYQQQFRIHGSASYIYSGLSTNLTAATITRTGAGWTNDQYKDMVVYPNVSQKNYSYKVLGNTSDTLTVHGPINLAKAAAGNTFAIVYGKLIKDSVNLSGITITPPKSGNHTVKFYRASGQNSFADADAYYNGICEVCHTQTAYHTDIGSGASHNNGTKCTSCHLHSNGFRGGCDVCHGNPPDDAGTLVFQPSSTGSATAGPHGLHATSSGYNFPCETCHYGGMPVSAVSENNKIQLGFNMEVDDFAAYPFKKTIDGSGTSYSGQTLSAPYSYEGTNNTSVTAGGEMTCSNVYCHTDGKILKDPVMYGYDKYPSQYLTGNKSAPWNNSSYDPQGDGNTCNNCHDYPPRYDSHYYHTSRGFKCHQCHWATTTDTDASDGLTITGKGNHANGVYDVVAGGTMNYMGQTYSISFTYTPAPGGGTCSSNNCHQIRSYTDPKKWSSRAIPTTIYPAFTWATSGSQQCSTGGVIGRNISIGINPVCQDCKPDYTYTVDWGDGTSSAVTQSTYSLLHTYTYDINSMAYPDRAYDIAWTVRDSDGITIAEAPALRTNRVVVCPQANVKPLLEWTWAVGPDPATADLIVTVTARDPDYNTGSHSGSARIIIDWSVGFSGYAVSYDVTLTDVESSHSFTYTYSYTGWKTVRVWIDDNAPEEGSKAGEARAIDVKNGSVTCKTNCTVQPLH